MKRECMAQAIAVAIVVMAVVGLSGIALAQPQPEGEGWQSLFNGKDLTGWVPPEGEHTWQVIDGVLDYEAKGGNLKSEREYGDYELHIEWRFKRTTGPPYNAKIFNPDGTQKVDENGKPMTQPIANADSGIFVRGTGQSQVNLWCWPCGSGQLWAYHTNEDPKVRAGALPKEKADKPVGEWNKMRITMAGEYITIVLNDKKVLDESHMPGVAARGPIVLQHHGGFNEKTQQWGAASALIQFRNIHIREM